jgi:colanic acid biosynthesis glycosyl transferase WcaI
VQHPQARIVIHDYGGYHFPAELGQAFARHGWEVLHLYFTQCLNPPAVSDTSAPSGYTLRGLSISSDFQKYSLIKRRRQEIEYGHVVAREIKMFGPDLVISANTPIDAQAILQAHCANSGVPFIFWLQDVISIAIGKILPRKLPVVGNAIGAYYRRKEGRTLRRSDAIVTISPHFIPACESMGVPKNRCHVVENWAPLNEITPQPRQNNWAKEHDLADKRVILYAGTLGFKHDPRIFEYLSSHFRDKQDVRIVVISEGAGCDWLRDRKGTNQLDNLVLLPYQPYSRLSEVLASGDVLLAILEEDAGVYSVPSKILSYLCAGRPMLLSVPPHNLAAETVMRAGAGHVVRPGDYDALTASADTMLANAELRETYAGNARRYAVAAFDIEAIYQRFRAICEHLSK